MAHNEHISAQLSNASFAIAAAYLLDAMATPLAAAMTIRQIRIDVWVMQYLLPFCSQSMLRHQQS